MEQNWEEMIKEGMKLIMRGCKKNTILDAGCGTKCPFDTYCTAIIISELTPPDKWGKNKEER